jgi:hypothetical protein
MLAIAKSKAVNELGEVVTLVHWGRYEVKVLL